MLKVATAFVSIEYEISTAGTQPTNLNHVNVKRRWSTEPFA